MRINETVKEVYESAVEKKLWDDLSPYEFYDWLDDEISEAYEAMCEYGNQDEPNELGDIMMLIMSKFGKEGWDLESVLRAKIDFNKTRPPGRKPKSKVRG